MNREQYTSHTDDSSSSVTSAAVTVPWSVCLFVCLSRSCIVLKWLKLSTRFLMHKIAPCLSQIVLKFGLHRSTTSSPNFAEIFKVMHIYQSIGDIRSQIAAEWIETAQWSHRRAYRKPPSLNSNRWPPLTSHSPKMGSQMQDHLHDARCHLANTIEDIDMPDVNIRREMSPFANLLWPLFIVLDAIRLFDYSVFVNFKNRTELFDTTFGLSS